MIRRIFTLVLLTLVLVRPAVAQDSDPVWVQVEAHPSLREAQEAIRRYSRDLNDVNGFSLGGGWYAIALGPYSRADANQVLNVLRAERSIPRDSYIAFPASFQQQFFPVGDNTLSNPAIPARPGADDPDSADSGAARTVQLTDPAPEPEPQPQPEPEPVVIEETPAEARRSEALLSRDERMFLQVALKWAGYYSAGIDGAFGRGTRGSMASWQRDNGHEPTGVLTTRQREKLIGQYNAVLEGLDLRRHVDRDAGIEMDLPLGVVAFDRYEAPFAHFDPTGTPEDARVILISQAGNQDTLYGLYDIMQTLAIVPPDGPRERGNNSFTLVGENRRIVSHTEVTLKDGQIKGFTLVWPAGDEERRTRLLGEMQRSFARLPGTLDPGRGASQDQQIDLVSGLEIRRPLRSRSGFFVDGAGSVVTTAAAVASCGRITLEGEQEAQVARRLDSAGVVLLRATGAMAPRAVAEFSASIPRIQSDISVAGYSYEGVLGAPTLTHGTLADIRGLNGEDGVDRLAIRTLPGDAGGPVFDAAGAVIGLLQSGEDAGRTLPEDVAFSVDGRLILDMLAEAGIQPRTASATASMPAEFVTRRANDITVLVSCWE
ncbi:trypsin-like peptidase domain-containing protein [Pseudooceanicola aestuarii]|uniref:trypsin-like peptidase domain-containing protein n=1 Tax=Pseudooceanicola aestuarii TaxID=2697319 RepID=UPI0013D03708|nr:trypsin-like peptidase domain-containing protein [Pseudooceanicola aestuarii]